MRQFLLVPVFGLVFCIPAVARADSFDYYINTILQKVPKAKGVKRVTKLTRELLVAHASVLKDTGAAFLVVRTNEGRWSKLLVHPAQQKISKGRTVPILLVERFVTYRQGEERAVQVKGKDVRVFKDFLLNLDLGQIVPDTVGGDIRLVEKDGQSYAVPVGKAEFYLVGKRLPEATPATTKKLVIGDSFVPQYFNGIYKIYDDGRRTGELHLKVGDNNLVTGHYYSGRDGRKYPVKGQVGDPHHNIKFTVVFPRTVQEFRGWMFTANGKAMTGVATMQQRETGFYGIRIEGKK